MKISKMQFDAILAGLRLLEVALEERTVRPFDGNVGDILTDGQSHEGLSSEKVAELAEELNGSDFFQLVVTDQCADVPGDVGPSQGEALGTYQVGIDRIGYRSTVISDVQATCDGDAARIALSRAGDIEFPGEHDADYIVSSVMKIG